MVQFILPKTATIPPRVFKQRSILAGLLSTICIGSQQMIFSKSTPTHPFLYPPTKTTVYYLPIWFQAIQGVTALQSGIHLLPLILSLVAASILSGILVHRVGYYTPFLLFGIWFTCVGAGLLTTLQPSTPTAKWIGYQVLYGWGFGLGSQAPNLAAQTVLQKPDVPIGTSLMFFSQLLGGTIFVSVGQNVFENQLRQRLASVSSFDAGGLLDSGATSLVELPASIKPAVLVAYNESLRQVFRVGLILTCITILGALAMEWRSVKKNGKEEKTGNIVKESEEDSADEKR